MFMVIFPESNEIDKVPAMLMVLARGFMYFYLTYGCNTSTVLWDVQQTLIISTCKNIVIIITLEIMSVFPPQQMHKIEQSDTANYYQSAKNCHKFPFPKAMLLATGWENRLLKITLKENYYAPKVLMRCRQAFSRCPCFGQFLDYSPVLLNPYKLITTGR